MGMVVINDSNFVHYINPLHDGHVRICAVKPRDWSRVSYGSMPEFGPPELPDIPMEEWPERIAEMDAKKLWADDVWLSLGIPALDQDGLSYCHAYSCADAMIIVRESMGLPYVPLSPESIGGPITGFRNEGAWIIDDLKQAKNVGASTTEFVGAYEYRRNQRKPGTDENCALHRIEEVWELEQRSIRQQFSALLSGFPTCDGYNWWGHAVTGVRIGDKKNGMAATNINRYRKLILNSWSQTWGELGRGWLEGSKMFADESYVIRKCTSAVDPKRASSPAVAM